MLRLIITGRAWPVMAFIHHSRGPSAVLRSNQVAKKSVRVVYSFFKEIIAPAVMAIKGEQIIA